jgi:hypothetical protein
VTSYPHAGPVAEAADAQFAVLAQECLDDLLQRSPDRATALGDHRFDDQLPDLSAAGRGDLADAMTRRLEQLDAVDDTVLSHGALLDFETLRAALAAAEFEANEMRRFEWDPRAWNPGDAVWQLVSRPVLEPDDLLRALTGRLRSVPEFLAVGRHTLGNMPRINCETAVSQLIGTETLFGKTIDGVAASDPALARGLLNARDEAVKALQEHRAWLSERLESEVGVSRDPRLGEPKFAAALWHALDGGPDVASLSSYASRALEDTHAALVEVAAMLLNENVNSPDVDDRALAAVAASGVIDESTILPTAREALTAVTQFTRDHDFVTLVDADIDVVEMPEIHRGVAVAYCDSPGPLEATPLPTFFAVAPPPATWSVEQQQSFYREYNAHMLHSLSIHEGVPGHALQLAHSRQLCSPTPMRQVFRNGAFVEGWAVYTEYLFAENEYPGIDMANGDLAWQLTYLKTRLRAIVNLLLDIGVHCSDMTESEAMHLMLHRAHQEPGEAAGKWRRVMQTAGQLSTYFAGFLEVSAIAADLRAMHPEFGYREVHDTMLSYGSPSTRVLRQALGLPDVLVPMP